MDIKFSPEHSKTLSITIAVNDVKPLLTFNIVPEVIVPYSINDNTRVATIQQALQWMKEFGQGLPHNKRDFKGCSITGHFQAGQIKY